MFPLMLGIISAGLSAFSAFSGAMAQGNQQRAQAANMEAQAQALRKQSILEQQKSEAEAAEIDRRKRDIRRQFNELQGHNRSLLGAGNVDMATGSALDVSLGNINRFAEDMGENSYQRAMSLWEGNETAKNMRYQADTADANASYLQRTAGNLGTSLLSAALSGGLGFASGYSMGGGKLSSLFGENVRDAKSLQDLGLSFYVPPKR